MPYKKSNILKPFTLALGLIALSASVTAAPKQGDYHGQVISEGKQTLAWHQAKANWLSIDAFWQDWVQNRASKNWPSSREYPIYDQVNETDTFLIQLDSGTCMMEFWHGRWRRANDVRRWDEKFNDYSACPYVFD